MASWASTFTPSSAGVIVHCFFPAVITMGWARNRWIAGASACAASVRFMPPTSTLSTVTPGRIVEDFARS